MAWETAMRAQRQHRGGRISFEQRDIMFRFMQAHPQFMKGRLNGPDAAQQKQRLIEELADKLNSCASGTTKSPDKWMKSWQDWRSDVKAKAQRLHMSAKATGGGQPRVVPLTPMEELLLNLIGFVAFENTPAEDSLECGSADPEFMVHRCADAQPDGMQQVEFLDNTYEQNGIEIAFKEQPPTPIPSNPSPTPSTTFSMDGFQQEKEHGADIQERMVAAMELQAQSLSRLADAAEKYLALQMQK